MCYSIILIINLALLGVRGVEGRFVKEYKGDCYESESDASTRTLQVYSNRLIQTCGPFNDIGHFHGLQSGDQRGQPIPTKNKV